MKLRSKKKDPRHPVAWILGAFFGGVYEGVLGESRFRVKITRLRARGPSVAASWPGLTWTPRLEQVPGF